MIEIWIPDGPRVLTVRAGLSEFGVIVIINHVPYAQSLHQSHRSCTYVTHP
jgi:hypothetical protein